MNEQKRKSPKRLIIDIPEKDHALIKRAAIDHNMTMKKFVLAILASVLLDENKSIK